MNVGLCPAPCLRAGIDLAATVATSTIVFIPTCTGLMKADKGT